MKKLFLFLPLFFLAYLPVSQAQRFIDLEFKLATPANNDTLQRGVGYNYNLQYKNLGVDTIITTDSMYLQLWINGAAIMFVHNMQPTYKKPFEIMYTPPGDSSTFQFPFTLDTTNSPGPYELCFTLTPFNPADSIADTVMTNNSVCVNVFYKGPDTATSVNNIEKTTGVVTVFPQPARGNANFKIELAEPARLSFQLTDLAGKVVLHKDMGLHAAGAQTIRADVSGIPQGMYIFTVSGEQHVWSGKLQVE